MHGHMNVKFVLTCNYSLCRATNSLLGQNSYTSSHNCLLYLQGNTNKYENNSVVPSLEKNVFNWWLFITKKFKKFKRSVFVLRTTILCYAPQICAYAPKFCAYAPEFCAMHHSFVLCTTVLRYTPQCCAMHHNFVLYTTISYLTMLQLSSLCRTRIAIRAAVYMVNPYRYRTCMFLLLAFLALWVM